MKQLRRVMETLTAAEPIMQWELYGPGTALRFLALRDEAGYSITVTKDHTTVMSAVATSGDSLFRQSSGLREHLMQLGFAAKPLASRAAQLPGGVCWGPATPLTPALFQTLRHP